MFLKGEFRLLPRILQHGTRTWTEQCERGRFRGFRNDLRGDCAGQGGAASLSFYSVDTEAQSNEVIFSKWQIRDSFPPAAAREGVLPLTSCSFGQRGRVSPSGQTTTGSQSLNLNGVSRPVGVSPLVSARHVASAKHAVMLQVCVYYVVPQGHLLSLRGHVSLSQQQAGARCGKHLVVFLWVGDTQRRRLLNASPGIVCFHTGAHGEAPSTPPRACTRTDT